MSRLPSTAALLDSLDEPALLVARGRTIAANPPARALLGDDIVDRDIRIALRQPSILQAIERAARTDLTLTGVGGVERPWLVTIRPLGDGAILLRFSDRSEAVAAERMRTDFVANASHELRTPLATITGYAETLEDDGIPDDLRRKFAATIRTEAARMQRIIEDLMSLSRIEAGRFALPRARVDVAALARAAAAQIEPLLDRRSCALETDIADPIPPIQGDEAQLLQVLDNLLSNAVRYGCNGRSSAVTLWAGVVDGRATVRIADQGDGIAAHHLPRLTERFYRVDNARSRESGGTGLGLAIVKHILERHRATLDFSSQVGRGTTVTIQFPAPLS
jgi:two-component system phosphate regulon sensor histidine kinase PhoR